MPHSLPFRPILLLLATIALALLLAGCGGASQRVTLSAHGIIVQQVTMIPGHPEAVGFWDASAHAILLTNDTSYTTLIHEIAHAGDTLGSYRDALAQVGDVPGFERQIKEAHRLADLADHLGGRPIHFWQALQREHGSGAVEHPEILAQLHR